MSFQVLRICPIDCRMRRSKESMPSVQRRQPDQPPRGSRHGRRRPARGGGDSRGGGTAEACRSVCGRHALCRQLEVQHLACPYRRRDVDGVDTSTFTSPILSDSQLAAGSRNAWTWNCYPEGRASFPAERNQNVVHISCTKCSQGLGLCCGKLN